MKKILPILLLFASQLCLSQSGIGTASPQSGAILDLSSTNKALLLSRVANLTAVSNPQNGMIVFDSSTSCIKIYQDGTWSDCIYETPGAIATINCLAMTNVGKLKEATASQKVYSIVSYAGGNAKRHQGQSVASTGITGLTATLGAGNFINGNGTLIYSISGIPSGAGNANFAINIGGKTCTLVRNVLPASANVSALNCAGTTYSGTLTSNTAASGVSFAIPYTGGNGGEYDTQTITSTGITGLTAILTSGTLSSGSGVLNFVISGTPSAAGNTSFAVLIAGKSCTITIAVAP